MIIIPDIHGRGFWKEAVKGHENEEMVFLGDYVDPYCAFENVRPEDGLRSLREVIAFKKEHQDNVTLLLGNHDLSYVTDYVFKCRHDDENHDEIKQLLADNKQFFKIAYEVLLGHKNYVFSHAGILSDWLANAEMLIGHVSEERVVDRLNETFQSEQLYPALGDVSYYRGGSRDAGSPVWADINEHFDAELIPNMRWRPDAYQIFGHTLQSSGEPVITSHFACLDCRHAFRLDEEGKIREI